MNCINDDLKVINKLLQSNKLSLNTDKTEFMLIGSRQRLNTIKSEFDNINISINGTNIKKVHECKHLGVIIDDTLTWNKQIDTVRKKCLKGMFMLKQCRANALPRNILTSVYNAIVLPHLDYCNIVWGNCGSSVSKRLQIIQNRAARIICGVKWDTSSKEVLTQLNWKSLINRQNYFCSVLTYKILNHMVPPYLNNIFIYVDMEYNFRHSKYNVVIPQPKTEYKKRSLSYRGAVNWNNLDNNVKNSVSMYCFKKQLKELSIK
jgi:hypothetical protein